MRELIRRGAELVLQAPPEWIAEVDRATLAVDPSIAEDPVLAAATRRTNRENLLHWAAANVRDPGAPVEANVGPQPLGIARDLVRRGLGVSALASYRAGQNAAWLRWMQIAFDLTDDPMELRELLDVTARSITTFVDATAAAIAKQMEVERAQLTRGTQAERLEVVALLLDGAPITAASAGHRLAYPLDPIHRAAVVWSEAPTSDRGGTLGMAWNAPLLAPRRTRARDHRRRWRRVRICPPCRASDAPGSSAIRSDVAWCSVAQRGQILRSKSQATSEAKLTACQNVGFSTMGA